MPRSRDHHPRRSWPQRLFILCNVVAILAASGLAVVLAYGNQRLSEVSRVAVADHLDRREQEEGDPLNILLIGVDDASGLPEDDSVRNARGSSLAGQLTDVIMIVRLDPQAGTAQLLSIPRDLWVPIAETNGKQRINSALETGGAARLIGTIRQNFGIPVHHYAQVDFAGFRELVDIVDGVPVYFPRPARDRESGLSIEETGCYTLGPEQALAFARGRYYAVQSDNGRWHQDPRSDLARNERQQLFIQLALAQAIAKGARNPNTLRQLIDLGAGSVVLDELWNPGDILSLGSSFRAFDPHDLERYTLPVVNGLVGRAKILYLVEDEAEVVLDVFRGDGASGTVTPDEVTVQVLNGTGVRGQGRDVTDRLIAAGFGAIVPDDADEMGRPTTIRYAEGDEAQAHLVARYVAGLVRYQRDPSLEGVGRVVLTTGSDWEGVASTPRDVDAVEAPATTTTTTSTTTTTAPSEEPDPDDEEGPEGGTTPDGEPVPEHTNDPGNPDFYKARAPDLGMSCPRTA